MYCIGLISGTSVDGIDAALVKITGNGLNLQVDLLQGETYPYSRELRDKILAVCAGHPISMIEFAELDDAIATEFAIAAQKIQTGYPTEVIGSHGQTVFHRPPTQTMGYTLQLGRGALIAHLTGIQTISNFRVADIAAGGQGAPLVSKIDVCLLAHPTLHRCIQNIGGIGNVTYLPPRNLPHWETLAYGWDTGPGNVLIDLAIQKLTQGQQTYDADGQWARQGKPCEELVQQWLNDDYFRIPPPKSTGRELFSPSYLESCWKSAQSYDLSEADWLATLIEFTVASIVLNYRQFLPQMPDEVLLCGGGSRNSYLKKRLQYRLGEKCQVLTTDDVGLNSDFKEAIAFAVLAYWRLHDFSGNLPHVTGAKQDMLLGEIHTPIV